MSSLKEVKSILKGLVISSSKGITITDLSRDYRNMVGTDIPFRAFGYSNVPEFLCQITDTLKVVGCGNNTLIIPVTNEKTAHIEDMVQKQKKPVLKGRRYRPPKPRPQAIRQYSKNVSMPSQKTQFTWSHSYENKNRSCNSSIPPAEMYESDDDLSAASWSNEDSPTQLDYRQKFGNKIETGSGRMFTKSQRNEKPTSFATSTPEAKVCDLAKYGEMNTRPFAISPRCSSAGYAISPVQEVMKNNLIRLISLYPDGIWCSLLPKLYREHFSKDLNVFAMGYTSVSQFCSAYEDIFNCIRVSKSDWKIYDARQPPPTFSKLDDLFPHAEQRVTRTSYVKENALPDISLECSMRETVYPENIIRTDRHIERQWLIEPLPTGFLRVRVSEVYDPSKFWIQWYHENCSLQLDNLMIEMQNFYAADYADEYKIPKECIEVGLYCVGSIFNEWHRAVISKIDGNVVKVFFFDYGTVAQCSYESIRFLHNDFAALPRQAIRARLATVRPRAPALLWSRVASEFFLNRVSNKILMAAVVNNETHLDTLDLVLIDTNTEDDVNLNDLMVEKRFADASTHVNIEENQGHGYYYLYPYHKEIEQSEVPTVGELDLMVKHGVPLELILKPYIEAKEQNREYSFVLQPKPEATKTHLQNSLVEVGEQVFHFSPTSCVSKSTTPNKLRPSTEPSYFQVNDDSVKFESWPGDYTTGVENVGVYKPVLKENISKKNQGEQSSASFETNKSDNSKFSIKPPPGFSPLPEIKPQTDNRRFSAPLPLYILQLIQFQQQVIENLYFDPLMLDNSIPQYNVADYLTPLHSSTISHSSGNGECTPNTPSIDWNSKIIGKDIQCREIGSLTESFNNVSITNTNDVGTKSEYVSKSVQTMEASLNCSHEDTMQYPDILNKHIADKYQKDMQNKNAKEVTENLEKTNYATSISDYVSKEVFAKRLIHIIKIEKYYYISTLELLLRYTRFDDVDKVKNMFICQGMDFLSIKHDISKHHSLMEDLLKYDVPGLQNGKTIELVEVKDVPYLLDKLFSSNPQLVADVKTFMQSHS